MRHGYGWDDNTRDENDDSAYGLIPVVFLLVGVELLFALFLFVGYKMMSS